jgi:GTP cyclohydrolase I
MITLSEKQFDAALAKLKDRIGDGVCYFVPTAGNKVYDALCKTNRMVLRTENPEDADFIIDDIIDSGKTFEKFKRLYCKEDINILSGAKYIYPMFVALVNKNPKYGPCGILNIYIKDWIKIFPDDTEVQDNIIRILQYIGEDVKREGLIDTPKRVMRSYDKLYGGYKMKPEEILKTTFTQEYNQMVLLKDIEFYSTCEHHMLPFYGKIHVGYIPKNKVVGISKLARLVECFARRLQIQERLVEQISCSIQTILKPKGVMVIAEAQHFCMTSRGVEKQDSIMVTSSIKGAFKKDAPRQEFLKLIGR